jgi:hypothetical protein
MPVAKSSAEVEPSRIDLHEKIGTVFSAMIPKTGRRELSLLVDSIDAVTIVYHRTLELLRARSTRSRAKNNDIEL